MANNSSILYFFTLQCRQLNKTEWMIISIRRILAVHIKFLQILYIFALDTLQWPQYILMIFLIKPDWNCLFDAFAWYTHPALKSFINHHLYLFINWQDSLYGDKSMMWTADSLSCSMNYENNTEKWLHQQGFIISLISFEQRENENENIYNNKQNQYICVTQTTNTALERFNCWQHYQYIIHQHIDTRLFSERIFNFVWKFG